jgi:hypothetical protein
MDTRKAEVHGSNGAYYQTGEDLALLMKANWEVSRLSRIVHRWDGRQFCLYLLQMEKGEKMLHLRIVDSPYIQRFAQAYSEKPIGWLNIEGFHPDDAVFETFYNGHPHPLE